MNDIRLVGSIWALDEIILSLAASILLYMNAYTILWDPISSIIMIVIGLQIAGLERFCVGYLFHSTERIELWHEDYHDQLRQRNRTKQYMVQDHALEIAAYCVVSAIYYTIFWLLNISADSVQFIWLGIVLEHYIGLKIRLRVQYGNITDFDGTPLEKFFHNAYAFYWYHILIDTHTCLGFSSPWFDTLFGTNPFKSQSTFSTPLPLIDFFYVDYSAELAHISAAFDAYNADPEGFINGMRKRISDHHRGKTCYKCVVWKGIKKCVKME